MIFILALLSLVVYALGVRAHDARHRRPIGRWQIVFFVAGVTVVALALAPPIDTLADASFTAHMAQHLALALLAAPLLLLGAPLRLALTLPRSQIARPLARALRNRLVVLLTAPVLGWLAFVGVMWATHLSGLYEAALENEALHLGEHGLFLATALLLWYPIVGIGPTTHPFSHLARLLYLFLAMPQCAFLGLAIYQARHVLYPHYLVSRNPFGISALADQRGAGELLWIGGSLVMFVALLLVAADWARNDARLAARIDARLEGAVLGGIIVLAFVLSPTLAPSAASAQAASSATQIRAGRDLYELHCSSCHGIRLGGSPVAPPLVRVGAATVDFWLETGRMPAMVPANVQAMHEPPQFSLEEINALVAYVTATSPGGPAIPSVADFGPDNLVRGRAIYAANCQACHGAMGQGGSVGYGYIAPPLYATPVIQVAEAIRTGPGPMPRFGPSVLSQRDLNAVVHYVNVLQTQQIDPGGFNLANIGPVAEGLVSWVLGLGVLLCVVRLIGSNT